jgi:hypothetical protein
MIRSEMCRQYAEECLRVAEAVGSERERRFLLEMARAWHALAQEREHRSSRLNNSAMESMVVHEPSGCGF